MNFDKSSCPINSEEVLDQILDGNPFYSILVASEIAIKYSVRSPLRGASGSDKPVLAIEKLASLVQESKLDPELAGSEIVGYFNSFSRRILNEGSELINNEYEDDFYQAETSDFEKLSMGQVHFSGEDDNDDDFDDMDDLDDIVTNNSGDENDEMDDPMDDIEPSEDQIDDLNS